MRTAWNNLLKSEKICLIISSFLLACYGGLMLYFCCRTDALVPDELWFMEIANSMKSKSFIKLLHTPNILGYGSLYWITLILLGNILSMRILSWACMMIVPICIILVSKKHFNKTWKSILAALVLFLSCPMAWFTGKIIGPELYGNALGIIGVTIILLKKEKKVLGLENVLGGLFIGLSAGMKLYNLIFGLFIGLYDIWEDFSYEDSFLKIRIKKVLLKGIYIVVGCVIGFFACCPFILEDRTAFAENLALSKTEFSFEWLIQLFVLERIEWDLVNSGGFCNCIISLIGLAAIFLFGCIFKETRKVTIVSMVSFLAIIILFSVNSRVLGWYFIPFLFILPLCVSEKSIYWGVLLLNLIFIFPDTMYQIDTKFEQIQNIENEEKIVSFIDNTAAEYEDFDRVYFVDVSMKNIDMCRAYDYKPEGKQFIVISERARNNSCIQSIYTMASEGKNGYSLINEKDGISIVIYNQSAQ